MLSGDYTHDPVADVTAIFQQQSAEPSLVLSHVFVLFFLPASLNAETGMLSTNGFGRIMFQRAFLLPATRRKAKMGRRITWAIEQMFEGWTCSECAWTYPIPELLADPKAKNAYDRIAIANFKRHDCGATPKGRKPLYEEANIERLRKLIKRGLKPKDAVAIMLQEVALECGKNPKPMEKARADAVSSNPRGPYLAGP